MAFSELQIPSKCHMSSPWAVRAMVTSESLLPPKNGYLLIISTQEGEKSLGDVWLWWVLGKDTAGFEEAVWITGDHMSRQTEVCLNPVSITRNWSSMTCAHLAPSHPGRALRADPQQTCLGLGSPCLFLPT